MSDYNSVAPPSNVDNNVESTASFADALQRAREIAAKINTPTRENTTNGTSVGQKRPLEVDNLNMDFPDASAPKKVAAMNDPYGAQLAAMQNSGGQNSVTEDYKVPDKMVGLIIGRGGEQITRLQADTACKVQMAAYSGGQPDRSCTLTGSRQAIEKCKEMIESIIKRGGPLPGGTGGMDHGSFDGMGGGVGGGGGGGGGHVMELSIPGPKVGLVIGKGGETIKTLQDRAGVKMVMIQEGPQITGQDKPLRITGDPQKCEHAKQMVMDLITEKELEGQQGRPGFRNQYQNEYGSPNQNRNEICVPKIAVGVVIGKGGEMIKKIQNDTCAKVQFQQNKDEGPGDRMCIISGTPDQVHHATSIIHDLINSVMKDQGGGGGGGRRPGPGRNFERFGGNCQETTFSVPAAKCGIVIGKGGETIRQINNQSGAHVELDRSPQQNPYDKMFIIRGTPDQIQQAQELIADKVGIPPPSGPNHQTAPYAVPTQPDQQSQGYGAPQGWGSTYQQWNQSAAPTDPATAGAASAATSVASGATQPDYSQAWIEYYRSMGMYREAEMVEQQARANQSGQPQQAVGLTQPAQPSQYTSQAPAAVTPQAPSAQPTQQYTQYGQYAAQPQQPQQFSGQQPAAGYNYNYQGYTAPQQ